MTRNDIRETPGYYGAAGRAEQALRVLYAPRPLTITRRPLYASGPARKVREGAATMSAIVREARCAERDA